MDRKQSVNAPFAHKRRTICEVHREIYDILYDRFRDSEHFGQIADLLQESYVMAKKMDAKLLQYKRDYSIEWYEEQKDEIVMEKLASRKAR